MYAYGGQGRPCPVGGSQNGIVRLHKGLKGHMGATWAQGIHAPSMDLLRGDLRAWRTHGQWTEETVDRVIDRGHQADWRVLRDAVLRSSAVRAMVIAISQERQYDDYLSHAFTFWLHYAQRAGFISARSFTDSPAPAFVHKQAVETLMPSSHAPDWEYVASAAARLPALAPGAAVVGGTAAALHAGPRTSTDADPILTDLESHFDGVLARLEAEVGWVTARTVAPKLILGHLDGVDTGIRQLIRTEPLETARIPYMGHEITVPTYAETLRIKGILILKRNQRRDYLDFAALAHGLSLENLCAAMKSFDRLYPQDNGHSPLQQLVVQLGDPRPSPRDRQDWKRLGVRVPGWTDWDTVRAHCLEAAALLWENLMPPAEASEGRRPPASVT